MVFLGLLFYCVHGTLLGQRVLEVEANKSHMCLCFSPQKDFISAFQDTTSFVYFYAVVFRVKCKFVTSAAIKLPGYQIYATPHW